MSAFIEVTSPTSEIIRWAVNLDQIVMVRRVANTDECTITFANGGSINPREKYNDVLTLMRIGPIA